MRALAMITARGGSKRIPRKNIKDFNGKPIIAYSIEAARASKAFEEVMVSTDDEEIAEIARAYGALVPFMRSSKTSNDYATTVDVIEEVIREYQVRGHEFDVAACIYPTAPFVTGDRLREAVWKLAASDADSLIPVVRFSYPPQRAMEIRDGSLVFRQPEYLSARSQDLVPHYHDAGQFYVFKVKSFRDNRGIMVGNILPMELSELEVQDIDSEVDWKLAELKYSLLHADKHNG
jgi:N-acylneuraminate cytidylyltransferase